MNDTLDTFVTVDLDALGAQARRVVADGVPATIAKDVRRLLVDTLGALLGGLRYPAVRALARELGDSAFGTIVTLGTAATWLDADSGGSLHPHGDRLPPVPTAHPAPHVLPVLLHAATDHDDSTLINAFAAGTELGLRLGAGSSLRPGLHPHGIHGPAGAAVTAAALAGADGPMLGRAFARGASLPLSAILPVPMAGGTIRNLWTGLGSWYGATIGRAVGLDNHPDDLPLLMALFNGAVCDELDPAVVMGTEQPWRLRDSYLKPYACARWIHPACDALRIALRTRTGDDIDAIEVRTFAFAASLLGARPATDMAARFSLPFSLATLAIDGRLAAPEFLPDRLTRPSVVGLAERIAVTEDPAFTAALPQERPTTVHVRFADGSSAQAAVRNARGNPSDPLTDDELEAKLRANVGDVLPEPVVDELAAWLRTGPAHGDLLARVAAHTKAALR